MIHEQDLFHNVGELFADGAPGLRLQRVPETVRVALNRRAQERMLAAAATEIRFVSTGDTVRVTLSSDSGTEIIPFFGPFQGRERIRIPEEPTPIEIRRPPRPAMVDRDTRTQFLYSPDVWRLTMRGEDVRYHGLEGDGLRPPTPEEVPGVRYLSYGTSITHGVAATAGHLTYVAQTAWRLGADLINLGVGGSAWCEPTLADYIGDRTDWDIVTLSLSVNMIGGGFSEGAFRERVRYTVERIAASGRPIACITLYPHFRDFEEDTPNEESARSELFRKILRETVSDLNLPNVTLVDGTDMLSPSGLTVDMIHPGDLGMIEMGEVLAAKLREILTNVE